MLWAEHGAVCSLRRPHQGIWLYQQQCTLGSTMQNWLSWYSAIIRDLLFASALMAHTLDNLQELMDCYARTAKHFGLTISLTKEMHQNSSNSDSITATIIADSATFPTVHKFTYLGTVLRNTPCADNNVSAQLAKAVVAFGILHKHMWSERGIANLDIFCIVVLITCLNGCEPWALYCQNMTRLDQFHLCLHIIFNIRQ